MTRGPLGLGRRRRHADIGVNRTPLAFGHSSAPRLEHGRVDAEVLRDASTLHQRSRDAHGRSANDVIWFEHGATIENRVTGCGVDHAHIHLLLEPSFQFERFEDAARSAAPWLEWRQGTGNPYELVSPSVSYLVAARGHHFLLASGWSRPGRSFSVVS